MGNAIDLVVSKQAQDGVKELISALTQADELILKFSSDALAFNNTVSKIKTPADLSAQSARNKQLTEQTITALNEQNKIEKQLITTIEKKSIATEGTNRELQKQRTLLAQTNKDVANQVKENLGLISSYDKLSQELTTLRNQAKATAVTFGLESAEFRKQAIAVQDLDGRLKKIDETLGQSQRNVGNYKSGFNALGNSISRLAQEAPNLGQSFQIFAMSVGNNFAQVKDAIDGIKIANAELAATGQPVKNVYKEIFKEVFSVNTLFYVSIALFVAFSKQIGEFTTKLFASSKAVDVYKETVNSLTEANVKAQKSSVEELNSLQANLAIAKDVNLSYKERMIAVDNLNSQYPFYFENLTKEQILAGDTAKAEKELTNAILARARANAVIEQVTKNEGQIVDLTEQRIKLVTDLTKAEQENANTVAKANANNGRNEGAALKSLQTSKNVSDIKKQIANTDKEIAAFEAVNQRLTSYALTQQKEAIGLDYKQVKAKKDKASASREDEKEITNLLQPTKSLIVYLEDQLKVLGELQKTLPATGAQYNAIGEVIKNVQTQLDLITNPKKNLTNTDVPTEFDRQAKGAENLRKSIIALQKATTSYLDGFSKEAIENSGFSQLFKLFDGSFEVLLEGAKDYVDENGNLIDNSYKRFATYFEGITEAGQQAFNTLNQLGAQNYDMERQRLDSQTKIAIANANGSDKAIKEIERQAEIRRRAIARREAQANKKTASFNVAINAAQGIVATFKDGFSVKAVVFAAALAAIAAVQIAAINAQQIPQYWQGGVHDGGLMMVNDDPHGKKGSNYKEVIRTPDGKVHRPQGRNVLMNAPKGTEIFKDEASFQAQYDNLIASVGISPYREYQQRQSQQGAFPIQEFRAVGNQIAQSVANMPVADFEFTDNRLKRYIRVGNSRTESMNNTLFHKGKTNA